MKNILIFIGGKSPEHEVSVVTGLQVLENIDRGLYNPILIYVSKDGLFYEIKNAKDRRDFYKSEKILTYFSKEEFDVFVCNKYGEKNKIYSAVNCLHGGGGENGFMAGFFESLSIPYSSTDVESSVLCMNKNLSKIFIKNFDKNIDVVESVSVLSEDVRKNLPSCLESCKSLGLPLIIKPVHLGSSIGIKVVESEIDLELNLMASSMIDNEILVEKFLPNIVEYNCSVKKENGEIVVSEIESPISKDQILSFSEKYQKGGKKSGGSGMASLPRNLPAKISPELEKEIKEKSASIYRILKCKGVVRIDFIYSLGVLYFNEINPIPGSMAYYLWEVKGVSFKDQLTSNIEESVLHFNKNSRNDFVYKSDIIQKFIDNFKD